MAQHALDQEILDGLHQLLPEEQQKVLDFVSFLKQRQKKGAEGKDLLKFAGTIPRSELEQMEQAIEEDCETIDASQW